MNQSRLLNSVFLATALLFAAALAAPEPAMAQRSERGKAEKEEAPYPNATRKEPVIRANSRIQKKVQDMFDAYGEDDMTKVESIAQELLGNAKAGDYPQAMANRMMAEVSNERDDLATAIDYLNKAIASEAMANEQHFQSMLLLAQWYGFEEREDEALAVMERFFDESGSTNPEYRMIRAQSLYRLERYDEAAAAINEVLAEVADANPNWRKLLLAVYVEAEKLPEAIEVGKQLLAVDPNDKPLLVNMASMYLDLDQTEQAVALLEDAKARGIFTAEEDYERLYRVYYNMEGQEAKTIAIINEGLDKGILKPGHQVYNLLGQSYYFSDQIEPAISAWTKAVEFASDGRTALNLARVYYNEERFPEAKTAIQKALQQGLENPGDGHVTLGNIELYGLRNKAAAAAAYREALKHPGSHQEQAQKGLAAASR